MFESMLTPERKTWWLKNVKNAIVGVVLKKILFPLAALVVAVGILVVLADTFLHQHPITCDKCNAQEMSMLKAMAANPHRYVVVPRTATPRPAVAANARRYLRPVCGENPLRPKTGFRQQLTKDVLASTGYGPCTVNGRSIPHGYVMGYIRAGEYIWLPNNFVPVKIGTNQGAWWDATGGSLVFYEQPKFRS